MKNAVAAIVLTALAAADVVDKSEPIKRCPVGFVENGKECTKTFTEPAQWVCGPGETHFDGKCAIISQKHPRCPEGFFDEGKRCVRELVTLANWICPPGYVHKDHQCYRKVDVGPIGPGNCPPGSVMKGDHCYKTIEEEPKEVCPDGYRAEDRVCIYETVFDCTPSRESATLDPLKPCTAQLSAGLRASMAATQNNLRKTKISHIAGWSKSGSGPSPPQWVEEYIVSKTCKRVIVEHPRKFCQRGSLKGKVCVVEIPVECIPEEGHVFEHKIPAVTQCPPGFTPKRHTTTKPVPIDHADECADPAHSRELCYAVEYKPHIYECPSTCEDLHDRCAIFHPLKPVCHPGWILEHHSCVRTESVPPIVEYIIKYRCTGKECEHERERKLE